MKIKDLTEGKTKRRTAPRAKHIAIVMAGRKGGGHYNAKTDYKRAKEKEKIRKEVNEDQVDGLPGQDPFELYRDSLEHIRQSINHLNRILSAHYYRGPRYDRPDRDTLARLARAASMLDNAAHVLAAGTPDDKQDPMDV